jgi:hypothetical protein
MQLGLRFAAAKLPGLRTDLAGRKLVEPSGALVVRGADRGLGEAGLFASRQVRCIIKNGSAVEP